MIAVVIDASVWVAAVDPGDSAHDASERFLVTIAATQCQVVVPTIARVEVACALARRFGDPTRAAELADALFDARFVHEQIVDASLAARALTLGTAAKLRGADALYAAVAEREGAALVTLDHEMLDRA
nr:type II toxin-antitoxin system VapC family toxin [Gemmatimonadales bacterium]